MASRKLAKPTIGALTATLQSFEFPHSPPDQDSIEVICDHLKRRGTTITVVVHPAPQNRTKLFCQIKHRPSTLRLYSPSAYFLSHGFGRCVTQCRTVTQEQLTVSIHTPSGPKRVAQKVKLNRFVRTCPIRILAVHYPGFVRVDFQSAFEQPLRYLPKHESRLFLAVTMEYPIIGITAERDTRELAGQPAIQCIV